MLKVLLDNSFILPTLGISTGRETITALKKHDEAKTETYYSTLTLLESLWIAARTLHEKTFDEETFKLGLRSILEGGRYAKALEDSWVFTEALSLIQTGASWHDRQRSLHYLGPPRPQTPHPRRPSERFLDHQRP